MTNLLETVRQFMFPTRKDTLERQRTIKSMLHDIQTQTQQVSSSIDSMRVRRDPIHALAIRMKNHHRRQTSGANDEV